MTSNEDSQPDAVMEATDLVVRAMSLVLAEVPREEAIRRLAQVTDDPTLIRAARNVNLRARRDAALDDAGGLALEGAESEDARMQLAHDIEDLLSALQRYDNGST